LQTAAGVGIRNDGNYSGSCDSVQATEGTLHVREKRRGASRLGKSIAKRRSHKKGKTYVYSHSRERIVAAKGTPMVYNKKTI